MPHLSAGWRTVIVAPTKSISTKVSPGGKQVGEAREPGQRQHYLKPASAGWRDLAAELRASIDPP